MVTRAANRRASQLRRLDDIYTRMLSEGKDPSQTELLAAFRQQRGTIGNREGRIAARLTIARRKEIDLDRAELDAGNIGGEIAGLRGLGAFRGRPVAEQRIAGRFLVSSVFPEASEQAAVDFTFVRFKVSVIAQYTLKKYGRVVKQGQETFETQFVSRVEDVETNEILDRAESNIANKIKEDYSPEANYRVQGLVVTFIRFQLVLDGRPEARGGRSGR